MRSLLKFLPPALDSVHWEKTVHRLWGGLETIAGTFPLESYGTYVAKEKRWILDQAGLSREFCAYSQSGRESGGHVGYLHFFPPKNTLPNRIEKLLMERMEA